MIDFDVDWTRWFDGIEQPNEKRITAARKDAFAVIKDARDVEEYMEEDQQGLSALRSFVKDVEGGIDGLIDAQEETMARFKDAEHAAEWAREGFAWFLQHHKAVLVTNRVFKSDPVELHPPEVVSWADNNARGEYQTFDVQRHCAIVFFDDTDRLHCKMRFG